MPEALEQPISERPLIANGRVWLRPMEERDLFAFMALVNDTEVGARAGFGAPFGPDGVREWFTDRMKKMEEGHGAYFTVCERGAGDLIGTVWLNHLSLWQRSAELAIAMDADHIGGGWGTEAQRAVLGHAFDSIGLHRIFLTVDVENARAIASYRKVGFVEEGRMRGAFFHDGAWADALLMSILEHEWPALRPAPESASR
jgi:RimJ/RimL family protein N-acetyltransferase